MLSDNEEVRSCNEELRSEANSILESIAVAELDDDILDELEAVL